MQSLRIGVRASGICAILQAVLCFCFLALCDHALAQSNSRGDMNNDGVVNAADVQPFALCCSAAGAAYSTACMPADVNGDMVVNAFDITGFMNVIPIIQAQCTPWGTNQRQYARARTETLSGLDGFRGKIDYSLSNNCAGSLFSTSVSAWIAVGSIKTATVLPRNAQAGLLNSRTPSGTFLYASFVEVYSNPTQLNNPQVYQKFVGGDPTDFDSPFDIEGVRSSLAGGVPNNIGATWDLSVQDSFGIGLIAIQITLSQPPPAAPGWQGINATVFSAGQETTHKQSMISGSISSPMPIYDLEFRQFGIWQPADFGPADIQDHPNYGVNLFAPSFIDTWDKRR